MPSHTPHGRTIRNRGPQPLRACPSTHTGSNRSAASRPSCRKDAPMRRFPVCALFVISCASIAQADPQPPVATDDRVPVTLLVQSAMQQGRECVARGEFRSAVRILEAQLPKINGHAGYLTLLEDAYRGYVKELRASGQHELAQRYLERLAILDPGVMLSAAVRPVSSDKETTKQGDKETGRQEEKEAKKEEARPQAENVGRQSPAESVIQAGDKEFL